MGRKPLIEICALIGLGLFVLVLGLYLYWINHFHDVTQFFSAGIQQNVLTIQVFAGVFIVSGLVMTTLGGLMAFRVRVFWWRIASVLLLVSLFLPWWQWSCRWISMIPEDGGGVVSAHNFLFGFFETSLSLRRYRFGFIRDIRFIPYFALRSASYSSPFDPVFISGSWFNVLLVQILCYVVFGQVLSTGVLGWSNKKKRRLIGVIIGLGGIVLFLAWLSLAWSALGLSEQFYKPMNPCLSYPDTFLSFGFFSAIIGVIILTVSVFAKDVEKPSIAHSDS